MAFPKLRTHLLKRQSEPPECHRAIVELHRAGRLNYFAAASYDLGTISNCFHGHPVTLTVMG